MPHRRHIYANTHDMAETKMCTYPQSDHALPPWSLYFNVMPTIHVLILLTKKHMINIPTLVLKFDFTFII